MSFRLCSDIALSICSICWFSVAADGLLAFDFEGFLRFIRFVFDLCEIPRGAGQDFAATLVHRCIVLDPNAPDTGKIHSRFYRNHVSRGKLCFLVLCQPGLLMNLKTQAVSGTMHEMLFQPVCREH